MLKLAYRPADQRAVLSWDEADAGAPWLPLLQDMVVHATEDALGEGGRGDLAALVVFRGLAQSVR